MAKRHLYEIDLMRTFIMMGVITVHTLTLYQVLMNSRTEPFLGIAAVHSSIHFTRESFMFITGLVLFITYYRKDLHPLQFWRKRMTLVVTPYVLWSIMDVLGKESRFPSHMNVQYLSHEILRTIGLGYQFHLYYVLVTIQLYIVFPALLWMVRKLERWHFHLFIVSMLFEMALMGFYEFGMPNFDWKHVLPSGIAFILRHHGTFILTYEFWFIVGGIVAARYDQVVAFIECHRRLIYTLLVIGAFVMWALYYFDRFVLHQGDGHAESVDQPIFVPWALVVTVVFFHAGRQWALRRERPGWRPFSKFIMTASNASFGIYLSQCLPLYLVSLAIGYFNTSAPKWVFYGSIPFAVLFTYLISMVFSHWISKVPVLSYLVGRKAKFQRTREKTVTPAL